MNDMTCVSGVELLMDYLEGVVTADVRAALEAHVAGCPRCVAFLASYRETPRILRDATAVILPVDRRKSLRTFLRSQGGLSPGDT
jgi:anti-sigma factor RsiW